jgi:hypothetical protein
MPATQTAATNHVNAADLTCPELLMPSYIESGRRYWECKSAGALIRMFAAAGCDVTNPDGEDDNRDSECRLVNDQSGNEIAWILWCKSKQGYAFARTPRVW